MAFLIFDHRKIGQAPYQPQVSRTPFLFEDAVSDKAAHTYAIAAVDAAGRSAATADLPIPTV
ncbi:MAG: hypothetical protein ABSF98_22620 [Bryobacteraceae bacterium]